MSSNIGYIAYKSNKKYDLRNEINKESQDFCDKNLIKYINRKT